MRRQDQGAEQNHDTPADAVVAAQYAAQKIDKNDNKQNDEDNKQQINDVAYKFKTLDKAADFGCRANEVTMAAKPISRLR